MYWLVFFAVLLSLCAREGKRATSDKPVSRLLHRFYEFGHRNYQEKENDAHGGGKGA